MDGNLEMTYIHEITFKGVDKWTRAFNACSELYKKSTDPNISEEERSKYLDEHFSAKAALELGCY